MCSISSQIEKKFHRLAYDNDTTCIAQLRMDRRAFTNLCTRLEMNRELKPANHLFVDEQVSMFLHIIVHHVKSIVIRFKFFRSRDTVSKYFHNVLHSVIRLHGELLKKPKPVSENSTNERWKWFKVYIIVIFIFLTC